ncbi:hypothetical protein Csa_001948 [Cucumis sativus]|uniref:Uncharacterized protein n=1 Tax=Cucumis sativus TaxID=3659 RepID=A0A0A0LEA2_CUCSA|nr:hypothetical protein Csa_001948 [Cucumis sativus]
MTYILFGSEDCCLFIASSKYLKSPPKNAIFSKGNPKRIIISFSPNRLLPPLSIADRTTLSQSPLHFSSSFPAITNSTNDSSESTQLGLVISLQNPMTNPKNSVCWVPFYE